MRSTPAYLAALPLALLAAGCAREGDFDSSGGIRAVRSACPAVAIPAYTGDVTLFNPPTSRDARAIDLVATITNLRSNCNEAGEEITADATFDVIAQRSSAAGPRDVVLPYFATVVQGGRAVVSKRLGQVLVRFEDGQLRGAGRAQGGARVNRAAATLPPDILERINRKRKAGDFDAAIDPFAEPEVRQAVARASFELLIGFQLSQDQLRYNATR